MRHYLIINFLLFGLLCNGQNYSTKIDSIKSIIKKKKADIDSLNSTLEKWQLKQIHKELKDSFLPTLRNNESLIEHEVMFLVYSEEHEQAKWVLHKISTNILNGKVSRTNDYRKDPLIKTESSEEKDFFLKRKKSSSGYAYEGFGYDRGHLAPSADFKWSQEALSESYFYSNTSPQRASFNRGKWADLEGMIRGYVFENKKDLYVYTGPVLKPGLKKIERSINGVSIPEQFFKIVVNYEDKKAIAYIIPQETSNYPVEYFATTIDEVEKRTGIDFLADIDDKIETILETQKDIKHWLPEKQKSDVLPIEKNTLGKGRFNTVQASKFISAGKKKEICGTVVSTHLSKNGHTFVNMDKAFPKQIFSLTIWKSNAHNFSYVPHIELKGRKVCVNGKITEQKGVATMNIENEKSIDFLDN
jgi:endonuclease G